ncbi:MAG: polysaccharide biosynthesis C-terminal domain-containing protein [Acutalibacteraceae bacterium]|nr:polysaccharide biosynthesis C-terminal domain-containing protein [Acutalibacteraceae bacterium]
MSSRGKKAKLNIVSVLILEVVTVISGLVLPRLILTDFGSATNGLVNSVHQFITCVTLLRAGVGGVTRAALYKPLAKGNTGEISGIVSATTKFMRKLTVQYTVGLFVFAIVYPFIVKESFGWFYSFSLVLILGLSTFFDCCFGITYQFLLQADQKRYVISFLQIATVFANVIVAVVLIRMGCSIHIVKLGSSLVYSVKPLILWLYVRKKYKLNWKAKPDNLAIKQRWDAFSHQLAAFVNNNTDVMLITLLADITMVSVFSVYNMVTASIRTLIASLTTGVEGYFGDVIAKKEELKKKFEIFETATFFVSSWVFLCVGFLITPFVKVYTSGVNDADYNQFWFGIVMSLAQFVYCIKLPYNILVDVSGHFKQTKSFAMAEAIINIVLSVILIKFMGITGVAIGTLIAGIVRTVHFVIYSNKNFLPGCIKTFVKHLICCVCGVGVSIIVLGFIPQITIINFVDWVFYAIIVAVVCLLSLAICYLVFFGKILISVIKVLKKK